MKTFQTVTLATTEGALHMNHGHRIVATFEAQDRDQAISMAVDDIYSRGGLEHALVVKCEEITLAKAEESKP